MTTKKILIFIVFILAFACILVSCASGQNDEPCTIQNDSDGDGRCDTPNCEHILLSCHMVINL